MKPSNKPPTLGSVDAIRYVTTDSLTFKRDENGHLIVRGLASDETLDLDKQICAGSWLSTAIPEWSQIGNVREMHGNSAVGKALSISQEGSGWIVESKIVDPLAAMKVEEGIYTGYSIGIKNATVDKSQSALAKAPNGIINGGKVVEISLVDRPANPSSVLEVVKSVGNDLVLGDALKVPAVDNNPDDRELEVNSPVTPELEVGEGFQPCSVCLGLGTTSDLNNPQTCAHCKGTKTEPLDSPENTTPSVPGNESPRANFNPGDKAALATLLKSLPTGPNAMKGAILDLMVKKGVTHDPAVLSSIRSGLVEMIGNELNELLEGEPELWDLEDLFCALRLFIGWWQSEAWEGETVAPDGNTDNLLEDDMDMISLGVSADIVKAAKADNATDDDKNALKGALVKALLGDEVPDIVKAVAGATEAIEGLTERLVKVEAMAAPGGPAKRASESQRASAPVVETLKSQIAELDRLALTMTNPDDARGYREDATAKRLQLASLTASA